MRYVGRFAPSPTGPLHAGSLVAALASWLDARAHGGCWLVRIEDTDTARCRADAGLEILRQLSALALHPDAEPVYQSQRSWLYAEALDRLRAAGRVYPCACSRSDIAATLAALGRQTGPGEELAYPGTCRPANGGLRGHTARAQRLQLPDTSAACVHWHDRRLGAQHQAVDHAIGDVVLLRADGLWSYQLACVVDDGEQQVTHVVRGEDLADNTPRQILLQQALGLPRPVYLHAPLVRGADGAKLSKQHGAAPIDSRRPMQELANAGTALGLVPTTEPTVAGWLASAVAQWRQRWQWAADRQIEDSTERRT